MIHEGLRTSFAQTYDEGSLTEEREYWTRAVRGPSLEAQPEGDANSGSRTRMIFKDGPDDLRETERGGGNAPQPLVVGDHGQKRAVPDWPDRAD